MQCVCVVVSYILKLRRVHVVSSVLVSICAI